MTHLPPRHTGASGERHQSSDRAPQPQNQPERPWQQPAPYGWSSSAQQGPPFHYSRHQTHGGGGRPAVDSGYSAYQPDPRYPYSTGYQNGSLAKPIFSPTQAPSAGLSTPWHLALLFFTFTSCGFLAPVALIGCIIDLVVIRNAGRQDTGLVWLFTIVYALITLVGVGLLVVLVAIPVLI